MAIPGLGFRQVYQLMLDMSMVLVEPYIATTLTTPVSAPGSVTVTVGSLGIPVPAVYNGALLVVDTGTNQEVVSVTAFNPSLNQFTADFTFAHPAGAVVISPTFPTQAVSGDPFFTQSEILNYIARAQNDFLNKVPCIFALSSQTVLFGQIYQQLVCDAIEIERIAASNTTVQITSLVRSAGVVTGVSSTNHNLTANKRFVIFSSPDPSFDGSFKAATIISPTSWTYAQDQPDSSSMGGVLGLWTRLYEVSQERLWMQNPNFRNQNITRLSSWYEDRTGNYRFGVNGKPSTNIPIELLTSIRDTDTLALTDYFLVPDLCLHGVKYRALEYAFSKDGQMRDDLRAAYCRMRADRVILAVRRFMAWMGIEDKMMEEATVAAG